MPAEQRRRLRERGWCVTHNCYCDGCGVFPIVGARFKCLQCPDFDLCEACFAKGVTRAHDVVFADPSAGLLQSRPLRQRQLRRTLRTTLQWCIPWSATGAVLPLVWRRFKSVSYDNFDLCRNCYDLRGSSIFAAIRTPLTRPGFEFPPWLKQVTALPGTAFHATKLKVGASAPAKTQSWGKLPSRYSALERALLPRLTFEVALVDSDCVLRRHNAAALGFQRQATTNFSLTN